MPHQRPGYAQRHRGDAGENNFFHMVSALPLILSLVLLSNCVSAQEQNIYVVKGDTVNLAKDTLVRNKLVGLNLRRFQGKPVAALLENDTISLYKNYWFEEEPPFKLNSLNLTYASGLYVKIYFKKLKYQPRFSKTGKFSFQKIQKETIGAIQIERRYFEDNVVKKYTQLAENK